MPVGARWFFARKLLSTKPVQRVAKRSLQMTPEELEQLRAKLREATKDQRRDLFATLRQEFPIHRLEQEWNIEAEVVLEAIARAPDFTQRGMRGVIAEACFAKHIVDPLTRTGWEDTTPPGDRPFDFQLSDAAGNVRLQVKNQRRKGGAPMLWQRNPGIFVVETQKSRKGSNSQGEDTRPYRFGEFDILAVCMYPTTNQWQSFVYTVARWLLPRLDNPVLIEKLQPIDPSAKDDWTSDFATAVDWFRSDVRRTIAIPGVNTGQGCVLD
jgi:hypothetical protein